MDEIEYEDEYGTHREPLTSTDPGFVTTFAAWVSLAALVLIGAFFVFMIWAFRDSDHCVVKMASDTTPVAICTK